MLLVVDADVTVCAPSSDAADDLNWSIKLKLTRVAMFFINAITTPAEARKWEKWTKRRRKQKMTNDLHFGSTKETKGGLLAQSLDWCKKASWEEEKQ